jgi:hypothetical protein
MLYTAGMTNQPILPESVRPGKTLFVRGSSGPAAAPFTVREHNRPSIASRAGKSAATKVSMSRPSGTWISITAWRASYWTPANGFIRCFWGSSMITPGCVAMPNGIWPKRPRNSLTGQEPVPVQQLRKLCGVRTAAVCSALEELSQRGEVSRDARGYQLKLPFPVSRPIDPQGNGNGKLSICSSGG